MKKNKNTPISIFLDKTLKFGVRGPSANPLRTSCEPPANPPGPFLELLCDFLEICEKIGFYVFFCENQQICEN